MSRWARWLVVVAVVVTVGTSGLATAATAASVVPATLATAAACGPTFTDRLPAVPWPLRRLQPEAAWPVSRGSGVVVAVIDSGVSVNHPKLAGQVLPGRDFLQPESPTAHCDLHGHGTLVAALIAGRDSPDSPFHGVAPAAQILPIRVLPNVEETNDAALPRRIAEAITWATDQGARVINLSLTTENTADVEGAVRYAVARDVVVVAAAGNRGGTADGDKPAFPAAYPNVIAVAGTDQNDARVSTSTTGDYVDVAAPGVAIEGPATEGNGYVIDAAGGTSFAAAYVSGVAALIRSNAPALPAAEVARRIVLTADAPPAGHDSQVGGGVVNPYRAVTAILDTRPTETPAPAGRLTASVANDDPLRTVRIIAVLIAVVGGVIVIVLVGVVPAVRRLRRRDHAVAARPGRGR